MRSLRLRAGGAWLHGLAPLGDLEFSTQYGANGGGLLVVSWSMALPSGYTHPVLRQGVTVDVMAGGLRIGSAVMAEPDREGWRFVADGLLRSGERFVAVDGTGLASTDLSVVIPAAIARGLPWRDPGTLPVGSLSADSEAASNLNYVTPLLNEYCRINGKRWRIDAHGFLRIENEPTTIDWALTPDVPAQAMADDDYTSRLFGRRVSAVSGTPAEPSAWAPEQAEDTAAAERWGTREGIEDLTDLGLITQATTEAALAAILASGKARLSPTQAVEVTRNHLTTLGGTSPELWQVAAGQRVRHFGTLSADGGPAFGQTREWTIGSTTYRDNEASIIVGPVGLAARTTAQVQAAVREQFKAASEGFR